MLFSAELPWCCFCVEIQVLGLKQNFARNVYINKENFWSQEPSEGAPGWAQPTRARHPLQARPGGCCPPGGPADVQTDAIKSHIFSKKQGDNYRVSRYGAATVSCLSSGGQVWSPFGAPKRGIFDLRHHQHMSISNSMMLPTRSE